MARSWSRLRGRAGRRRSGIAGWGSSWRIPSASVWGAAAMSATSATGAAGTPAAVRRSCQCAVVSVRSRSSSSAHSASRLTDPVGVRPEARVVDQLGGAEHVADRAEQPVVAAGDHQLSVAGREDLVRRDHREARSLAGGHRAVGEVAGEVIADVADRRLVQRDVDGGGHTGAVALEERGEDAERRPGPGSLVDQRGPDPDSRPSRLAGHRDQPAGGLHEGVVAGLVRERADAPVGAERSSRRSAGCARATRRARDRAPRRARVAGSGGRRPRARRAGAAPHGRPGRGARGRSSACRRSRRGTSCPRRSRTAAPRRGRRRPCRAARP